MKASILTIGDEILNGSTLDTNSAFIAKECVAAGLQINNMFSVSDSFSGIYEGLQVASNQVQVVFITGGLGPTKDDITKEALCNYFTDELVFNETVFEKLKTYFEKRGAKQVELNKKLAYLPKKAQLIPNNCGTALGMWFEKDACIYVSMPGVPHEMKAMLLDFVLPKLKERLNLPNIVNSYIMCAGIGESGIYEHIEDIENNLPPEIKLAYLPNLGYVKLRLTYVQNESHNLNQTLENIKQQIIERIKPYVYSLSENEAIANVVGNLLLEKKATITTAESCTGGYMAHLLTSIPGSSAYYEGSVIAYSYDIKETLLDVKKETLLKHGAVSKETVEEMAKGVLKRMQTDYAISISGIAGPGGGLPDKPVGTVWIAVASKTKVESKVFYLTNQRDYNIKISAHTALNMFRNFLIEGN